MAFRKQIRLHHAHLSCHAKTGEILARAGKRAWVLIRGHDCFDPATRQHRGKDTGARADIEGHELRRVRLRQWRGGNQTHILSAHGREHAVVRMNAIVRRGSERRDLNALLAPLVRPDDALQLAQGGYRITAACIRRAPCLPARLPHVRGTAKRDTVVGTERDQQRAQNARALRLRLTVLVKGLGQRVWWRRTFRHFSLPSLGHPIRAPRDGLQQLRGIVEITAP